jgi:cysteine desulfurase
VSGERLRAFIYHRIWYIYMLRELLAKIHIALPGHFHPRKAERSSFVVGKVNMSLNDDSSGVVPVILGITTILMIRAASRAKVEKHCDDSSMMAPSVVCPRIATPGIGESHLFSSMDQFKGCIYLDYNATTPVFAEVFDEMSPYLSYCFGNPSSTHIFSAPCRAAIMESRQRVGTLIGALNPANEIIFTSCGTESDNRAIDIALHHFAETATPQPHISSTLSSSSSSSNVVVPHVITCEIEHPAILNYLKHLCHMGSLRMTVLSVTTEGFVLASELREALTVDTALVSIMHSNNEVGTIQPIRALSDVVRSFNRANKAARVLFHSDAAQSLGKVAINVTELHVDMLTVVGHKFGAPKGVAALYVREGVHAGPMLFGGGQERGLRSGNWGCCLRGGEEEW